MRSAARRSCSGFRYENRKQTARASAPSALSVSSASSSAASSRGVSTPPSARTRSGTPSRR